MGTIGFSTGPIPKFSIYCSCCQSETEHRIHKAVHEEVKKLISSLEGRLTVKYKGSYKEENNHCFMNDDLQIHNKLVALHKNVYKSFPRADDRASQLHSKEPLLLGKMSFVVKDPNNNMMEVSDYEISVKNVFRCLRFGDSDSTDAVLTTLNRAVYFDEEVKDGELLRNAVSRLYADIYEEVTNIVKKAMGPDEDRLVLLHPHPIERESLYNRQNVKILSVLYPNLVDRLLLYYRQYVSEALNEYCESDEFKQSLDSNLLNKLKAENKYIYRVRINLIDTRGTYTSESPYLLPNVMSCLSSLVREFIHEDSLIYCLVSAVARDRQEGRELTFYRDHYYSTPTGIICMSNTTEESTEHHNDDYELVYVVKNRSIFANDLHQLLNKDTGKHHRKLTRYFDLSLQSELNKIESAESQRNIAESKRNIAESKRNIAESKRNIAESKRNIAESKRNIAESDKRMAELDKIIALLKQYNRDHSQLESATKEKTVSSQHRQELLEERKSTKTCSPMNQNVRE